jgi:hypothetical protein
VSRYRDRRHYRQSIARIKASPAPAAHRLGARYRVDVGTGTLREVS